jgi:hypothetical protein
VVALCETAQLNINKDRIKIKLRFFIKIRDLGF